MWRQSGAALLAAAAGSVVVTACIGALPRDEFQQVLNDRGGGFTEDLPLDALDTIAERLGDADLDLRSMTVSPSSAAVIVEVRDPQVPENLDQFEIRNGDVVAVEPVRVSATEDLDATTFPVADVAFDRFDEMVAEAIEGFDADDGFVTSVSLRRRAEQIVVSIDLGSDRAAATAVFTADGDLLSLERS